MPPRKRKQAYNPVVQPLPTTPPAVLQAQQTYMATGAVPLPPEDKLDTRFPAACLHYALQKVGC